MAWFFGSLGIMGVVIFFVILKRSQDRAEANFQERFADKKLEYLDKVALYVARESDGYSHFRGVGHLVLTKEELFFERRLDNHQVIIPTSDIIHVSSTRRLAGQNPLKDMLKVEFKNENDEADAIAWVVKDLDGWINKFAGILKK